MKPPELMTWTSPGRAGAVRPGQHQGRERRRGEVASFLGVMAFLFRDAADAAGAGKGQARQQGGISEDLFAIALNNLWFFAVIGAAG